MHSPHSWITGSGLTDPNNGGVPAHGALPGEPEQPVAGHGTVAGNEGPGAAWEADWIDLGGEG